MTEEEILALTQVDEDIESYMAAQIESESESESE